MKKPNACPMCDYKTSRKSHIIDHINRVHKHVKNYACSQCDYKAYDKGNIETHINAIHRRLRSYACSECDYKASKKFNLKAHINAVHKRLRNYACSECDYKASKKINLINHVKVVHRKLKIYRYTCTECDYTAANKFNLVKHIATRHRRLTVDHQAQTRPNSDNHKNSVHIEPNSNLHFNSTNCVIDSSVKYIIRSDIGNVCNKETPFSDGTSVIADHDENAEAKEFVEDEKKSSVFKVAEQCVSDTTPYINAETVTKPNPKQCTDILMQRGTDLNTHSLEWTEEVENSNDITVTEFDMKQESHSSQDTDDSNQQINCSDKHMNAMNDGASNQRSNDGSDQYTSDMLNHSYNEQVLIDLTESRSTSRAEHINRSAQCTEGTLTDLEAYACNECRYETSEKEQLIRRIDSRHSEEIKSLACPYCSFRASYKCHLARHVNGVHMNIRPHACGMCDYAAKTKSNLLAHTSSVHKNMTVSTSSDLISPTQKRSRIMPASSIDNKVPLDAQHVSTQKDFAYATNSFNAIAFDSNQQNSDINLTESDSKQRPTDLTQLNNDVAGSGPNQYNNDQATVSTIDRSTEINLAQFTSDTKRRAEIINENSQMSSAGSVSCSSCIFRAPTRSELMNHIRRAHKDDCI